MKQVADLIDHYGQSHHHRVNRVCHSIGIPLIAASIPLFLPALLFPAIWRIPVLMFIAGWILQFVGHAFERKMPEFFHDWRFLFVGLRWWWINLNFAREQIQGRLGMFRPNSQHN
jgi:uncharacterized membrane protein YGL010W